MPGDFPNWLAEVQRAFQARGALVQADPAQRIPRAGELRLARPVQGAGGVPRFIAIRAVDSENATCEIHLCTNEVEMATDKDILLTQEVTCLPFDLLLETDIVGSLWWSQLDGSVAEIELDAILLGQGHGLPVRGPGDARWAFKQRELNDYTSLVSDCVRRLMSGLPEMKTILDPALLTDASVPGVQQQAWLALLKRPSIVPPGALNLLAQTDGLDIDRMFRAGGLFESSRGDATALFELWIAGVGSAGKADQLGGQFVPARAHHGDLKWEAFQVSVAEMASPDVRDLRVATTNESWRNLVGSDAYLVFRSDGGGCATVRPAEIGGLL